MQQQHTSIQISKRTQRELENKIFDLEKKIEKQELEKRTDTKMQEKIKKQEEENQEYVKGLQIAKEKYEQMFAQRTQTDLLISDWLEEIKDTYAKEMGELTQKNIELITSNEILLQSRCQH